MKKQLQLFTTLLALICLSFKLTAQIPAQLHVFENWTATDGTQGFYYKSIVKTDPNNGDVVVAGATVNVNGDYDVLVVKYNSKGELQWTQQYDGGCGTDGATAMVLDDTGNVYITGITNGCTSAENVLTQKYDATGNLVWTKVWNSNDSLVDGGAAIALDSGNVYVTGFTLNGSANTDFVTIKYNNSGTKKWAHTYDYSSHLNDGGYNIIVDAAHKVRVTGGVQTGTTTYKCAILEYSTGGGYCCASVSGSTSTSHVDLVNDVATDATKHIYIAGGVQITNHGYDYCVIKLDSLLNIVWEKHYNTNDSLDDVAKSLAVDDTGNVYVTGFTTSATQQKNYTTQKYNISGTLQWTTHFNDTLNGTDEATALIINSDGQIYVTGNAKTAINGQDYYTIKYDNAGNEMWSIYGDSYNHLDDFATCMAFDIDENLEVTGQCLRPDLKFDYRTIQYVEKMIVTPDDLHGEAPSSSFLYYHNRGQLVSADSVPVEVPEQVYYTNITSPALYIQANSFSFVFAHVDTTALLVDTMQRIDVFFNNALKTKTYPMQEQPSYLSYFTTPDLSGITEIHGNQQLVTPDLYPNIDLIYYSNGAGFKYYFVVKPGGDPRAIEEFYDGASSTSINVTTHVLTVNSSIGSISFQPPKAYQLNSTGGIITLTDSIFDWTAVATDTYQFDVTTYDNSKVLVIEVGNPPPAMPTSTDNITWSTYVGGSGWDQINDIKSDGNSNLFVVGKTKSPNFPQASGVTTAFQFSIASLTNYDGFVSKYFPSGEQNWSTYIGSNWDDDLTGFDVSPLGNNDLYCVGNTNSNNGIIMQPKAGAYNNPTFVGPYDVTYGWLSDGFIFQLAQNGITSPWRTYCITGNSIDYMNKCKFDANGNLFVVGSTNSSDAPVFPSSGTQWRHSWNNTAGADFMSDGYIIRFDANGARTWATCVGSSTWASSDPPNDELNNLDIDANGDLYVVGRSLGSDYPNTSTGSGGTASTNYGQHGIKQNGVITRFGNTGVKKWSSYIGSTGVTDIRAVRIKNNNIYITGTTSTYDLQSGYSPYFYTDYPCYCGGYDAFFAVYNNINQLRHLTYFGGSGDDEGWDIQEDASGFIYIAGKTASTNFPTPVGGNPTNTYSHGAFGNGDYFVMATKEGNDVLYWSTEVGGASLESVGNGRWVTLSLDENNGHNWLHLAGESNSADFLPLNNGGGPPVYYQGNLGGGFGDGTITRFDLSPVQLMGIKNNGSIGNDIFVYPNPATSSLTIKVNKVTVNETYKVYNNLGQVIAKGKILNETTIIDLESLTSGLYFLEVSDGKTNSSVKFIKNE